MTPDSPPLPVATVSVLDVFTKVIEMQVQLASISEKLNDIPDHEVRIRTLETGHNRLAGAATTSKVWATVISAMVTAAGSWIGFLVTHR